MTVIISIINYHIVIVFLLCESLLLKGPFSVCHCSEEPTCIRCTLGSLPGDKAEQLSDFLLGFGAQSVVVEEDKQPGDMEQQIFGVSDELWDKCRLIAYFELEVGRLVG
jgi:hypothetical protein